MCDESTASIDEGSNAIVHDELLSLPATVFFVCHRLEVCRVAVFLMPFLPMPLPALSVMSPRPLGAAVGALIVACGSQFCPVPPPPPQAWYALI